MGTKGLRNLAIVSFVFSLGLLLWAGFVAMNRVAPIPKHVAGEGGELFAGEAIWNGQHVFQSRGLMDQGSVWGHGTLRGQDFAATTLHWVGQLMREYHAAELKGVKPADGTWMAIIESAARPEHGSMKPPLVPEQYPLLSDDQKAAVDAAVIYEMKANRYDEATETLKVTPAQTWAYKEMIAYWDSEFSTGDRHYGILPNTIAEASDRHDLAAFFLWTAWAAGTNRPGLDYTYTNNWPADKTIGNVLPAAAITWSILSILSLMGVLGFIVYVVHRYQFFYGPSKAVDAAYALLEMPLTASQRATGKFFLVAGLLFLAQILNGGLMANYTVKPATFYIQYIGDVYPYNLAKTWHVQLAIFWIAISWVGTSIFVAPAVAGREPKGQKFLVNLLFWAVVVVVVGSLLGEWLSITGRLGKLWFWLGDQGWEYLELGRLWQILLFVGLIFWLVIVYRVLAGALAKPAANALVNEHEHDRRSLVIFYVIAAILIVGFFGFGLFYNQNTHITVADYWRWFVVHIWVESIFEFFGVAVVALFLVTLGLVSAQSALRVAYLTATITFLSGIAGVAHHYFWFGGPNFWLAIGGVFSSLEPIPLILLVVRAWLEYKGIQKEGGGFPYRWPLYFLVASSFWNFLGAGVFGFMINLPVINYYEHATYLTTNHAHTALFGVYGMLAVSLILFSWRGLVENKYWNSKLLKISFWGLNGGLFLMFTSALLPMGLLQVWQVASQGLWHARSAEHFYETPLVRTIASWRIVSDTIIIVFGALPLLYFMLTTFFKLRKVGAPGERRPQSMH